MVIKQYYSPAVAGDASGESLIFKRGLSGVFEEIRQSIFQIQLMISPRPTKKAGKGATGNPKLAEQLNKAFKEALQSLGWRPRKAPGASEVRAEVDWFKSVKSPLTYGPKEIGLGLEIQFGNNFQFNEDLKRLSESVLEQKIVSGVCMVASDELAKYKADRGASFSDSKSKLDRFLAILTGAGAAIVPPFVLIGVGQDGFTEQGDGLFCLAAPVFGSEEGVARPPVKTVNLGTVKQ